MTAHEAQQTPAGKLPPQNIEAEKSLLGAILIDEEVLADASELVKGARFLREASWQYLCCNAAAF